MTSPHHAQLLQAPWPGISALNLHSARSFRRHWHGGFGIGWVVEGGQRSWSGRGPVEARRGDVISHNPGEIHDGLPMRNQPRRWAMLHVQPEALTAWLGLRAESLAITRPVAQDERLRAALQRVFAALAEPVEPLQADEALAALWPCLMPHLNQRAPGLEPAQRLLAVRERLAADPPPRLPELAAIAGLSPGETLRQFKQAHGLTPHAWRLQQRLQQACARLRLGEPLAEVALASGFADQSHFTRQFTRQFGVAPGRWQQAQLTAQFRSRPVPR